MIEALPTATFLSAAKSFAVKDPPESSVRLSNINQAHPPLFHQIVTEAVHYHQNNRIWVKDVIAYTNNNINFPDFLHEITTVTVPTFAEYSNRF